MNSVPIFIIFSTDLHGAIKYCSIHYFVDDANLLDYNNSVEKWINNLIKIWKI